MTKEQIRDARGNIIGTLETNGTKTSLRNPKGNIVGTYDSKTNKTVDYYGKTVGTGNLLMRLL